ncbi:MAG TPA: hypothetical protein VFX76_22985, partial [Roseiflexaceae bacterium]|nr:hypothetical protein [Roseiflexaceae bacterium]
YHLVRTPAIHAAIGFLLEHLPQDIHLVLATREDPPLPLSRMRARGQLAEVRVADLQFTPKEGAEVLAASMGLHLTDEHVAVLVERTEGWVAGLQLAALALRDREDPAAFLAAFAGSHRLVADYLTAEVIDQQPAALRRFLLTTSVLHRLSAPLCDALLERTENPEPRTNQGVPGSQFSLLGSEIDSQETLEALERANLFLVPMDDERRWYRYHHLFADLLRQRLKREIGLAGVNDLYRRAYLWHERHDLREEAVNYALAAHDWPAAARIMEQLSTSLWTSSRYVLKWIESLPEEEVEQSPDLSIWYAGWQITCGEFGRLETLLNAAERVIRASGPISKLAGVYVYRALAGFLREDAQPTIDSARQAMAYFDDKNHFVHGPTIEKLARGYFLKGDLAEAERVWAEATAMAQAADGQRTMLFIRAAKGEIQRVRGNLRQAVQLDQELLQQISRIPADVIKIKVFGRLSSYYYEWNQFDQAEQSARQALELAGQTQREVFARAAYLTFARIAWTRGEAAEASDALERARETARRMGGEYPMAEVEAYEVRLWLAQGAHAQA